MSVRAAEAETRCLWCGNRPLYVAYHDDEWGVPERDDRALFEKLILDGFQAGLSWWIVLQKREHFRAAFDGFDPEKIARYKPDKLARLMEDPGLVRNRAKIEASVVNAKAFLALQDQVGSFAAYLWGFVDGAPKQNRFRQGDKLPAQTPESQAMAKDLKERGFSFCGPTITYAFMQAVGMVNDHVVECFRYSPVHALSAALPKTTRSAARRSPKR